jgi:hypothetical protein
VVPDLRGPRYDLRKRAKDTLIHIGGLDPGKFTLLMLASVTRVETSSPPSDRDWMESRIDLRELSVSVFHCFTNLPSANEGLLVHFPTKAVSVDGHKPTWDVEIDNPGLDGAEMPGQIKQLFRMMHEVAFNIASKHRSFDEFFAPMKKVGPGFFTREHFAQEVCKVLAASMGILPRGA